MDHTMSIPADQGRDADFDRAAQLAAAAAFARTGLGGAAAALFALGLAGEPLHAGLAAELGLPERTVGNALGRLHSAGLTARVGRGRYRLAAANPPEVGGNETTRESGNPPEPGRNENPRNPGESPEAGENGTTRNPGNSPEVGRNEPPRKSGETAPKHPEVGGNGGRSPRNPGVSGGALGGGSLSSPEGKKPTPPTPPAAAATRPAPAPSLPGSALAAERRRVATEFMVNTADDTPAPLATEGVANDAAALTLLARRGREIFPGREDLAMAAGRCAASQTFRADWVVKAMEVSALKYQAPPQSFTPILNRLQRWAAEHDVTRPLPPAAWAPPAPATVPFPGRREPGSAVPVPPEYVPDPAYAAKLRRQQEEREARVAARTAAALDNLPDRLKQFVPRRALP